MIKIDKFFLSAALLIGTIIGAGIFAIPYVVAKSGIIPGFFYFLILGGVSFLVHLFLGEIVLRTEEKHRLAGYAKQYLGGSGSSIVALSIVLGTILSLVAYIILGGQFLKIFFSFCLPFFNASNFRLSLAFALFLLPFLFRGIKNVAKTELFSNILFGSIIVFVFLFSLPNFDFNNFSLLDSSNIFLPYGVILFALTGWSAIPEMAEILKSNEDKKKLKKIIIFSISVAIFIYLIFILAVVGVSGSATTEETFIGLLTHLDNRIILLGVLAGIITIADSFLILSINLKNTLIYDYGFSGLPSLFISWFLPVFLFFCGLRHFIDVIGVAGTLIGAIEGIAIIVIFRKAKLLGTRKPEYSLNIPRFLEFILIAIFILGALLCYFKS
jgi:amino acid permease